MVQATSIEFARHAWDFRDAAIGAQHLLGEREEYLLHASLPVACLFGTCIDLALRSYILAADSSLTQFASPDCVHDLESLFNEANRLGLAKLVRVDNLPLFRMLSQLRAQPTSGYCGVKAEAVPIFETMKELAEKLLEIADVMSTHERATYE